MMHALEDSFHIVMYSCTHNYTLAKSFQVCRNSSIQLILTKKENIFWQEALYHIGSKLRPDPEGNVIMGDCVS